ncbi:MAG: radical SAM protein, partial [Selenomonadaceae bacterium]|nr:radical SAM protein [Selenomonadaceae bacterium]
MIHRFKQGGQNIVLDVNSGAVHLVDEMLYEIIGLMEVETPRSEIVETLSKKYSREELEEALTELDEVKAAGQLFSADMDVPPTFQSVGVVKSLCLMVAQDCNLRCKYCFGAGGSYGHRGVMSEDVGKAAVDFIIKNSYLRKHCEIDFFGGEPLINFRTVKAVTEYVRRREVETGKKIKLTLTTNGVALDDEKISWLNDNNISLVLSLDGRREVHDAMRPDLKGRGSYDIVVKNFLKTVQSRGGDNYYLRGTYTNKNLDFASDVESMLTAGFDVLSIEPVVLKDSPLAI